MIKKNLEVVIVSKDRPDRLIRCIAFLLSNTVLPSKILIIDSSTSVSFSFKKSITNLLIQNKVRFKYLNVNVKGISRARNIGIKNVSSPYFAFIDDDEIAPPQWVSEILKIIVNKPELDVLCGPKIGYMNDYWNRVWKQIMGMSFKYIGPTEFVPSGNSIYKTSFLKKNNIYFDEKMEGIASEDSVLSMKLVDASAKIEYNKNVFVYHDFRSSLFPFIKQWFSYGKGNYHFYNLYKIKSVNKVRKFFEIWRYFLFSISFSHVPYRLNKLTIGHIIKDVSYTFGFYYSFFTGKH